jgi:Fe-S oxidoreductase
VIVHAHVGRADICRNVDRLLRAIPEIEIVETVFESGYTCGGSGCGKAPELAAREHGELVARAHATGADILVTSITAATRRLSGLRPRGNSACSITRICWSRPLAACRMSTV